jgi:hypothetical protein
MVAKSNRFFVQGRQSGQQFVVQPATYSPALFAWVYGHLHELGAFRQPLF